MLCICGNQIEQPPRGRRREYCSAACKQKALRFREKNSALIDALRPTALIGDSLASMRSLPDRSVNLIIADPPYNVGVAGWDKIGNGSQYRDWLRPYLVECYRLLADNGMIFLFGVPHLLRYPQAIFEDELGMTFQNWICWRRRQGGRNGTILMRRHEDCLLYSKTDRPWFDPMACVSARAFEDVRTYGGKTFVDKNLSDVWEMNGVQSADGERTDHPTQKPVALIERMIAIGCPFDGVVLDPFGGSGTTSVAAIRLRRQSIYCERDADYAGIADGRFTRALADTAAGK